MSFSGKPIKFVSGVMLLMLALMLIYSLKAGPIVFDISTLFQLIKGEEIPQAEAIKLILFEIRLPRAILAIFVGLGLGMSGAALQALVKNPLAEPGILGISSSSALGAVAVFYFGNASNFTFALTAGGLLGAIVATGILLAVAARGFSTLTLILAGIALNALSGAVTSLALNLAPNPFAAYEIYFWLMGSLANRSFDHVWLLAPFTVLGSILLFSASRRLDAFAFGEEVAGTLGVNVRNTQLLVVGGTALAVGAGVAVVGVVGFVGLVVPHLLRPLIGNRPSRLIPLSGLGGALLTLAADNVCRLGTSTGELKIGVVTALLGAPFLMYLVLRGEDKQ